MNRLTPFLASVLFAGSLLAPLAAHAQTTTSASRVVVAQDAPETPPEDTNDQSDGSASMPDGSASVPDGWHAYTQSADGYALAVPPTWRQIDLDPATVSASVTAVSQNDPAMSSWLTNQVAALVAAHVRFFAFDFAPQNLGKPFATNLNVVAEPAPTLSSLDLLVQVNLAQLENLPAIKQPIQHQRVALPGGAAERLQYSIDFGTQTVSTTQFVFLAGGRSYVLTFSTMPDQLPVYSPVFDQIAQTFQPIV